MILLFLFDGNSDRSLQWCTCKKKNTFKLVKRNMKQNNIFLFSNATSFLFLIQTKKKEQRLFPHGSMTSVFLSPQENLRVYIYSLK